MQVKHEKGLIKLVDVLYVSGDAENESRVILNEKDALGLQEVLPRLINEARAYNRTEKMMRLTNLRNEIRELEASLDPISVSPQKKEIKNPC